MKTLRDTFEENYMAVAEPGDNKKGFKICYLYTGPWYVWNEDPDRLKTRKRVLGTACAISILAFLAASMQDSALNYSRYVELPGMLSIAALVFEIFGVAQFCMTKDKVTSMDFHDIDIKLKIAPLLHSFLLFCTAIVCIYRMFIHMVPVSEVLVPLFYILSGVLSFVIFYMYQKIPYITKENEYDI